MRFSRFLILAFITSPWACQRGAQEAKDQACQLNPGNYPVQTATYKADQGAYELFVLNAPACFQQPLKLSSLQLARMDEKEATERVRLVYSGDANSTLYMAEDFKINMVQKVTENGVTKEQSGSWSPFVTGLAGAAVGAAAGAMITRAMNKPQYYTPPPMQAGSSQVYGYGGAGATKEGAVHSYQQRYASAPSGGHAAVSSPSVAPAPSGEKKSFFKSKSTNTVQSAPHAQGAARTYQPAPSSAPKRGFFKSRRR